MDLKRLINIAEDVACFCLLIGLAWFGLFWGSLMLRYLIMVWVEA